MKQIYWRPQGTPVFAFVAIALFSLAGMFAVEHFQTETRKPYYQKKIQAARLAMKAMEIIRDEQVKRGFIIDRENDPTGSGLIGSFATPVTSDPGELEAKQTSINPNFAAVVVDLLRQAGVREGDTVAVSFSGSFPAMNIAVCSALKVLGAKPTIISSASASQWGANDPHFLWIDMETLLFQEGLFPFRSVATSMGGKNDRGRELTGDGRKLVLDGIERNGLTRIEAPTLKENVDKRMAIYFSHTPPKAYINVGGGVASAGLRRFKNLLKPGLLKGAIADPGNADSVIQRFLKDDIPVVHLENVKTLAVEYKLPVAPTVIPRIGEGRMYHRMSYNKWLAGSILLGIIFGLYAFSRSDWGFRILQASSRREEIGPPEPML